MMKKIELDEPCQKIFMFLVANSEGIGFNKLGRELKMKGFPLSNPTLSAHLKHLTEMELITRKKIGIQTVNYKVNMGKYRSLRKTAERMEKLREFLEEEETKFNAKPLGQQINFVSNIMLIKSLEELRTLISCVAEPEKLFENRLKLIMLTRFPNDIFERWFLAKCKENPSHGKQAMVEIDKLMKNLTS